MEAKSLIGKLILHPEDKCNAINEIIDQEKYSEDFKQLLKQSNYFFSMVNKAASEIYSKRTLETDIKIRMILLDQIKIYQEHIRQFKDALELANEKDRQILENNALHKQK